MHDPHRPEPASRPPLAQDVLEHAVLTLMLHRRRPHIDELVREIGDSQGDVSVAVTALVGAGVLHRHDDFVFPTRAAIRLD